MYTLRQKVVWFAVSSRVFIILLQCVSNMIIPDHDAKDVFQRPLPPTSEKMYLDGLVDILLGGLERWDAHYFLHIAENGYVYENSLAFFPLFPITVRFLSVCFNIVTFGALAQRSLLLLASTSLNTICFVKAADALYCLGLKVLENQSLAYKAALLFCINPASIFFSAPYSEALFVLLSFQGMRHSLDTQYSKLCAIPFGLAAAARSNGILNVGYILHANFKEFLLKEWPLLSRKRSFKHRLLLPCKVIPWLCQLLESCIISLAPFIAYQVYCYVLFCTPQKLNIQEHVLKFGQEKGFVLPNFSENLIRNPDHWCHFNLPLAYSYVQDHYWNVGFLKYYQWKQIPNFMLASPIILFILWQSGSYFLQHKSLICHLGLKTSVRDNDDKFNGAMSPLMFVFVIHVVSLTLFCVFLVHIQVTTRMICSASPVLYWYAAYMLKYKLKKRFNGKSRDGKVLVASQLKMLTLKNSCKKNPAEDLSPRVETLDNMNSMWKVLILSETPDIRGKVILTYFISYSFVGTVLFSNFLPWT